jgi:putative ABC transport system permease protein
MLKNYFKTAWRSLISNKTYGFLNIVGLSTGLAVALIIGLWVYYQFSFDRFLPGYTEVYKVGTVNSNNGEKNVQMVTPYPLGEAIKKDIPGVKYVTHTDWIKKHGLLAGETKLYLNGAMAGSDFLKIFRYPLLKGSAEKVLNEPYSIVLTESTARTLFGSTDPMNKIVRIDNRHDLKVTGILRDVPKNSTLQFNYIVPFQHLSVAGAKCFLCPDRASLE